jgi:hypothetical protein
VLGEHTRMQRALRKQAIEALYGGAVLDTVGSLFRKVLD